MASNGDSSTINSPRGPSQTTPTRPPIKTRDSLIREYVQQARRKLEALRSPQPDTSESPSQDPSSIPYPLTSSGASNVQYFIHPEKPQRSSTGSVRSQRKASSGQKAGQAPSSNSKHHEVYPPGHLPSKSVESTLTIDSGQWPVPGSPVPPVPALESATVNNASQSGTTPLKPKSQQFHGSHYSASIYSERPDRNSEHPSIPKGIINSSPMLKDSESADSPFRDPPSAQHAQNASIEAIPEEFESHSSHTSYSHSRQSSSGSLSETSSSPYDLDRILSLPNTAAGEKPALVRQASLGRRHTATLTVIPPTGSPSLPQQRHFREESDVLPNGKPLMPTPLRNTKPRSGPPSPAPSSEHGRSAAHSSGKKSSRTPSPASVAQQAKEKKLAPGDTLFLTPSRHSSLKDRVGSKKPPSLIIEPVPKLDHKRLEKAKSQTSIAGLISRALRMASDLERGNTSSKSGNWFEDELLREKAARGKSTTSLNSMLDGFAFSPTIVAASSISGQDTPRGMAQSLRPHSSMSKQTQLAERGEKRWEYGLPPHSRKKICGIPVGICIAFFAVAVALIALAIILPVTLIIVPRSKHHTHALTGCSNILPCANGGASVVDLSGNCQCVCTNDFTGHNCTTPNNQGCGPILTTTLYNASIGSSLAPLIYNSESNYDIPLNASALIPIFSANNLNCDSQNGLISLSGLSARSLEAQRSASLAARATPSPTPRQQVVTTAGIAMDGSTATAPAPASSTTSSSSSSSQFNITSPETLGFARTAILFVVQADNDLNSGVVAQSNLQNYINQPTGSAKNVSLGDTWSANLVDYVLTSNTGGVVGESTS